MKEFNYVFLDGIKKGLRNKSNNSINSQALVDLLNAKVGKEGLEPYINITNVPSDVSLSWPFPQIFLGSKYCFIADETAIYNIPINSIIGSLAIATEGSILDELGEEILDEIGETITWSDFSTLSGLTSGNLWNFTDFGNYCLATNGSVIVYIDLITDPNSPNLGSMSYSATFPRCKSYCNFNGQLIGGGVKSTWYDCDESSVIWSKIGSADFTPQVSMEAGYKVLTEFSGKVHKIRKLGSGIIVYGDNGILLMKSEGIPFGFYQLSSVGIYWEGAAEGDLHQHIFIDKKNKIWRIQEDFKLEELDYSEYMAKLTHANIVISQDKFKKEFYISDGVKTFLLTQYGLSEVYQRPTSIINLNGTTYGVCDSSSATGFILETDRLDFGIRGLKTLSALELGLYSPSDITSQISWRSNIKGSFAYTPTKLVNPNGVVYPQVTADEFKIKLTSTAFANIQMDYMNVRLNLTDKRSVRGRLNVA
jgi:hypothetical protein